MGQDAEEFRIRLDTIAGGAAMDRFDEELSKVLGNIADPNTNPEKIRSITIKITMRPNKVRDAGEVVVSSEAKLAPVKPADATVFFGKVGGAACRRRLGSEAGRALRCSAPDDRAAAW